MLSIMFLQFISILAIGVGVMYAAFRWKIRNPRFGWFNDYFQYLLFFYISAFIYRFVPHIIEAILRNRPAFMETYYILTIYLVLPLSLLYLLFFIRFSAGFAGLKIAVPFQRAYIVLSAIVFLSLAAWAVGTFNKQSLGPVIRPFGFVSRLILTCLFLLPIWAVVKSRSSGDIFRTRAIGLFAVVHCCCLAAYEIFVLSTGTDVEFAHQLFRFCFNIPPLIVLYQLPKQQTKFLQQSDEVQINSEALFDRFRITKREQDIIRFVCLGKTNAEIGKELFISVKTVKRHLYNIYQKLRVKNRVQLVNMVLNSGAARALPDT